jgi:hypothetical protein
MTPRNKNLDTLVSHGFYLDSKLLAESYFVSLRETVASGAKIETVSISSVSIFTLAARILRSLQDYT